MYSLEYSLEIISAPGAIESLPEVLYGFKMRKPFVIAGSGVTEGAAFDCLKAAMPHDMIATVFLEVPEVTDEESVISALALYRATHSDGLIVHGGRSALDLGKAVLLSASHDGPLYRYNAEGTNPKEINNTVPPFIVIPVTNDLKDALHEPASVVLRDGRSIALQSPHLSPKKVILDLSIVK